MEETRSGCAYPAWQLGTQEAGAPRGGLWVKPEQKFAAGIFIKMQRTSAQSQFFFRA